MYTLMGILALFIIIGCGQEQIKNANKSVTRRCYGTGKTRYG